MENNISIKIKKLDENAVAPSYAHDGDIGMDITAIGVEYDEINDVYIYHTGLSVETEQGYGILLFPRSSNRRTDAYLTNHVGLVDSATYRGEIMFCYKNRQPANSYLRKWIDERKDYETVQEKGMRLAPYKVGERIGQMVAMPFPKMEIQVVDELSLTERGDGGFGSTGK